MRETPKTAKYKRSQQEEHKQINVDVTKVKRIDLSNMKKSRNPDVEESKSSRIEK